MATEQRKTERLSQTPIKRSRRVHASPAHREVSKYDRGLDSLYFALRRAKKAVEDHKASVVVLEKQIAGLQKARDKAAKKLPKVS